MSKSKSSLSKDRIDALTNTGQASVIPSRESFREEKKKRDKAFDQYQQSFAALSRRARHISPIPETPSSSVSENSSEEEEEEEE